MRVKGFFDRVLAQVHFTVREGIEHLVSMAYVLSFGSAPGLLQAVDMVRHILHYANFALAILDDIKALRDLTGNQDLLSQLEPPCDKLTCDG